MSFRTLCRYCIQRIAHEGLPRAGIKGALMRGRDMNMDIRNGFFQLVSTAVGLSLGLGVATATVLLGVAALLQ